MAYSMSHKVLCCMKIVKVHDCAMFELFLMINFTVQCSFNTGTYNNTKADLEKGKFI